MNKLVSIVTPSYNQVEFLEATIQSVIAQEYSNLEYIIVDGGSTDGSVDVINKYSDQLSWWISESDQGQADGINKGLRRSQGEIVAWLNSDDLYLPGAIRGAVAAFDTNTDLGMVYGNAITIDQEGTPLNQLSFGDWGLPDLMHFRIICQPSVFIRRSVFEKVGFLDDNFHYMLDHHLWLRIASNYKIKHFSEVWSAARHHSTSKNVAQSEAFADETYHILKWMQTDPKFIARFEADRRRIIGGANRLAGRYLLDGGKPRAALIAYIKALFYWPSYAIQHWGRMIFALVNLIGFGDLDNWAGRQKAKYDDPQLIDWPGIRLKNHH